LTPSEESVLLGGVTNGRNGKGVIYVWAAGNGRGVNQNISYDGYASSRYTIAVGASGGDGRFSTYSEPGASMLVTAPSSFSGGGITTTTGSSTYTNGFGGTSASAPMVSGVVALLLEANPNLGWRDVQRILLTTATKIDLGNAGWAANGAQRLYNHNYGYGRVNAASAVSLASTWTSLEPELSPLTAIGSSVNLAIPDNNPTGVSHALSITTQQLFRVEHVEVTVNITHPSRGDLAISLTSPQGMRSVFTSVHTDSADDYNNWKFTSVAHWDENPSGNWTLKVNDGIGVDVGTLNGWSLKITGTAVPAVFVPTHTIPFFSEP
jgi:kexin